MSYVPWSDEVADTKIARLAWSLHQTYRWDYPPHLAVEALAESIAARFQLTVPVAFEDGVRFLESLGVPVEIGDFPLHGRWEGEVAVGEFKIQLRRRDAETRKTLTLFHEFYELLRAHLHAFECAPFPGGMKKTDYVPERMARRFSAAITLPRSYVLGFINQHGLDIPLLAEQSGRSSACVIRRVQELVSGRKIRQGEERHKDDLPLLGLDVPFLALRFAIGTDLVTTAPPKIKCAEHVRSHHLSIRKNRQNSRDYRLPRKDEVWTFGPLLERVLATSRPTFTPQVTGFDLFRMRDLCALATPEWKNGRMVAVALYATPADTHHLWVPVVERLGCDLLDRVVGLVGAPVEVKKVTRAPRLGPDRDIIEAVTRGGEPILHTVYCRYRPEMPLDSAHAGLVLPNYQMSFGYREDHNVLVLPQQSLAVTQLQTDPSAVVDADEFALLESE